MKAWPLTLCLVVVSVLVGCSTPATMRYDLTPPAPGTTTPGNSNSTQYRIASIEVPESLDIESLIVRQPDNSLMMLSHDKWVGSLGQAFQNAVTDALANSLGLPPLPASMLPAQSSNITDIAIKVEQFEMQPANKASLAVLWQVNLYQPRRARVTCYMIWAQPVAPGVAALVAAQQANVQQLAKQIASTLQTGKPPEPGNCQVSKA